jgi:hypothetical protein
MSMVDLSMNSPVSGSLAEYRPGVPLANVVPFDISHCRAFVLSWSTVSRTATSLLVPSSPGFAGSCMNPLL